MAEPSILYSSAAGVGTIVLNRPKEQNSLDAATGAAFIDAIARAAADDHVRVVVLAANGPSFSAGGDFNWVLTWPQRSQQEREEGAQVLADAVQRLYDLPKPTIARVQGAAVGGGVGLMLACDWAIGSDRARVGLTSVRNGLLAGIAIPVLIQAVGPRVARQLLTHGGVFGAEEARRIGLLDRVVPAESLDSEVATLARELMLGAPGVQALLKRLVTELDVHAADQAATDVIAGHVALQANGAEAQEGMSAFLQKRKARWVPT
jgi:methylglutaconyl-CoA hydratase